MALLKGEEKQKHSLFFGFFSLIFLTKRFNKGGGKINYKKKKKKKSSGLAVCWVKRNYKAVSVNEWLQGSPASLQLFTLHEHLLIQAKGKQAIFPLTYIINPSQKGFF